MKYDADSQRILFVNIADQGFGENTIQTGKKMSFFSQNFVIFRRWIVVFMQKSLPATRHSLVHFRQGILASAQVEQSLQWKFM